MLIHSIQRQAKFKASGFSGEYIITLSLMLINSGVHQCWFLQYSETFVYLRHQWKETPCDIPKGKLSHKRPILDFPSKGLSASIKTEVWILQLPRGQRCMTMTSALKVWEPPTLTVLVLLTHTHTGQVSELSSRVSQQKIIGFLRSED